MNKHLLSSCLLFFIAATAGFGQTNYYTQTFTSNQAPSVFYNAASPSNTQVTSMGPIGYYVVDPVTFQNNLDHPAYWQFMKRSVRIDSVLIASGNANIPNTTVSNTSRLVFRDNRSINQPSAYFTRALPMSPTAPTSMLFLFDMRITNAEIARPALDGLTFVVGSNFSDDASTPAIADTYAKFALTPLEYTAPPYKFKVTSDANPSRVFQYNDYSSIGIIGTLSYKIAFVVNNRTVAIPYGDEFGHSGVLAPDTYDLWIGPEVKWVETPSGSGTWIQSPVAGSTAVKVFSNQPVTTPTQNINNFKFLFNPNTQSPAIGIRSEIEIDNILFRDISGVLPVTYAYFRGNVTDQKLVNLSWGTVNEYDSDYFMVQRTQDLMQPYQDVAYRKAAGSSNTNLNYNAIDESPLMGITYYRLKQVDANGTVSYSRPVTINVQKNDLEVSIYPNPSDGQEVYVQVPDAQIADIQVFNSTGFRVNIQQSIQHQNLVRIKPTETLPQGLYIVQVRSEGDLQIRKLIVK
jgi:hypothetical protein